VTPLLADWPVTNASVAVVTGAGPVHLEGPSTLRFWLASLTKPLTALATLVAVEEGAVELDSPVEPAVDLPAELAGITLRQLLAHASGLAPDRIARAAAPGTRRIYSNAGFEVIGSVVTAATGIAFADYVAEGVFGPLGMSSATLAGSPARDGWASVNDWVPVLQELLAPTRLLAPQTLSEAVSAQFPGLSGVLPGYGSQPDNAWGLGFELRDGKRPHWTSEANSPATYGHFGQGGTMFWVDPTAGVGVVALADEPFGAWSVQAWPELSSRVLQHFG
jgi:CubicO group peptidase (beta-lactamase class C family)